METTWNLDYLYKSFEDPLYAKEMSELPQVIRQCADAIARKENTTAWLEEVTDSMSEAMLLQSRLGGYASLRLAADASCTEALSAFSQLEPIGNDFALTLSALVRALGDISNLDQLINASEKLKAQDFAIHRLARHAAHLIPESIESWILKMRMSGGNAFSQLRDLLDAGHTVSYRGEEIPLSAVRGKAHDPDPRVRKDAYEAEIAGYDKISLPMSYCLNSIKMEARTLSEAQKYPSVLDMTLDQSNMDQETLDAMLSAIQAYLPDFRRYLRAKAKLLGHENGLPFYDLFAPVGECVQTYTLEESKALLMKELGKFSPEMAEFIGIAFDNQWMDLLPREGKSGGAFCAGTYPNARSSILSNFQGSLSDVSTLAHELGHAWHNHCMQGLPISMTDAPMPLAETASIFNETMLKHQLMATASPEERLALLEGDLMEATQVVVDIYSRFLFEKEVIDTRPHHAMTVEELKDAMLRAQNASYGDGLDPEVRHPFMWACKSHYYSADLNFYNFPYAFGFLFGLGVFAKYLKEGADFVPQYNAMLRRCGSDTVYQVAKSVGIDVRDEAFWRSSLDTIQKSIDTFEFLVNEKLAQ